MPPPFMGILRILRSAQPTPFLRATLPPNQNRPQQTRLLDLPQRTHLGRDVLAGVHLSFLKGSLLANVLVRVVVLIERFALSLGVFSLILASRGWFAILSLCPRLGLGPLYVGASSGRIRVNSKYSGLSSIWTNTAKTHETRLRPIAHQSAILPQPRKVFLFKNLLDTNIKSPNQEHDEEVTFSMSIQLLVPLAQPLLVPLALRPNFPNRFTFNLAETAEDNSLWTDDTLRYLDEGGVVRCAVDPAVADIDLREEQVEVRVQGADVDLAPAVGFGAGELVGHEIFEVEGGEDGGFEVGAREAELCEDGLESVAEGWVDGDVFGIGGRGD